MNISSIQLLIAIHLVQTYATLALPSGIGRPIFKRGLFDIGPGCHHGHRLTKRTEEVLNVANLEDSGKTAKSGAEDFQGSKDAFDTQINKPKGSTEAKSSDNIQGERFLDSPPKSEKYKESHGHESAYRKPEDDKPSESDDEPSESDDESLDSRESGGGHGGGKPEGSDSEDESMDGEGGLYGMTKEEEERARMLNLKSFETRSGFWEKLKLKMGPMARKFAELWNHILSLLSKRTAKSPPPGKLMKVLYINDAPLHLQEMRDSGIARESELRRLPPFKPRKKQVEPSTIFS